MDADIDSLHAALIDAVRAAGGSKRVAAMLWPAKAARNLDDARRYLANCLDPERAEKLALDEVLLIMREARTRGCHTPMQWLARELHYAAPVAVAPRDEADDLRRRLLAMSEVLSAGLERLRRLEADDGR